MSQREKSPPAKENLNDCNANKGEIEPTKDVIDIDTVKINKELPIKQRNMEYLKQIKNPERYIYHNRLIIKKYNQSGVRFKKALECIIKLKVEKSYLE